MLQASPLPLPTTISVHHHPVVSPQRSPLRISSRSILSSVSETSKSLLSSGSEQESYPRSNRSVKRSFTSSNNTMNYQYQHEIPPPPKLRRLVASYWKLPADTAKTCNFVIAPVTPTTNWESITQGPPASGSYDYDEHYYTAKPRWNHASQAMVSPGGAPQFCSRHRPNSMAVFKPTASKPFHPTNKDNYYHHETTMMQPDEAAAAAAEDDEEMMSTRTDETTLANDSHKLFETVKQAVAQFGHRKTEDEEDDEELTEFLQYASNMEHPDAALEQHVPTPQQQAYENNNEHNTTMGSVFQAVTPSPDPMNQPPCDRKLPPILPPLHRNSADTRGAGVYSLSKKYQQQSQPQNHPYPPFFAAATSLGSIPREIVAPVVYPPVVIASQGAREDPMDPRFGIEHPPRCW